MEENIPTKEQLKHAAMHLLARGGPRAASVRSIAKRAGVTEAALYRHYKNKDDLYFVAYTEIIQRMVEEKIKLLASDRSFVEKIREWVRLTYRFFDENPDAFTCVLLRDDTGSERPDPTDGRQSGMFSELVTAAQRAGEFRQLDPTIASSLFSGVLLQIPRLINLGALPMPAATYTDVVADAALKMFIRE